MEKSVFNVVLLRLRPFLLLLLFIVTAYAVQAQLFREAVVVETINIFPEKITSIGWKNTDTITFQNLDEDSLSQEFTAANSATLKSNQATRLEIQERENDKLNFEPIDPLTETTEIILGTTTPNIPDQEVEFSEPETVEVVPPTPVLQDTEVEPEVQQTSAFKTTRGLYQLAIGEVSETTEPEVLTEEVVEPEQLVVEEEVTPTETVSEEDGSDSLNLSVDEIALPLDDFNEDSDQGEVIPSCDTDCLPYEITLDDFSYPLDSDVEVLGAQFRLSLAAIKKEGSEKAPKLQIVYSLDRGLSWDDAGSIDINDESSNSENGGYFLFALPDVVDQSALDSLQIKIVYQDDPNLLKSIFVESAWLELFTSREGDDTGRATAAELLANDGFDEKPLSGDTLELPDGEIINFDFTDENTNESLIIKSSASYYQGLTKTKTYFSVTNTSDKEDDFSLQAYFPENVGEVKSLKEFSKNVPRTEVIPEYRPFVYNCEAGWNFVSGTKNPPSSKKSTVESEVFDDTLDLGNELILDGTEASTVESFEQTETVDEADEIDEVQEVQEVEETQDENSTTVSRLLTDLKPLTQFSSLTEQLLATSSKENKSEEVLETVEESVADVYSCPNTNEVRECDELDGAGTACVVSDRKVDEHVVTRFAPGWVERVNEPGALPKPNLLRRVTDFLGFGPKVKEVPDNFEARVHTPDTYALLPGETKYFEMEISFPQFSSGEYWIEAVGKNEYGLLDPFWSSNWQYKMPITIDNTAGGELLEQQVFLELDSSLTDFWTNVASDGSDIRFVQEFTAGSNEDSWLAIAWDKRLPITIQSSEVDSALVDFPVYVDLSTLGPDFWSGVQASGGDIRVTTADGKTELPFELVSINTGSDTGELYFNADAISDTTDTTFYIYYDNPIATGYAIDATFGAEATWNSDYEAVYHLGQSSTGAAGEFLDSTDNNNDGTGEDTLPTVTTGRLGSGQSFSEAGKIDIGTGPSSQMNTNTAFTLSAWINQNSSANDQGIISQYAGAGDILFWADTGGASQGFCNYNGSYFPNDCFDTAGQNPGNWQHVVAGYGAGTGYVYLDSILTGAGRSAAGWGIDLALPWAIGAAHGDVSGAQSGTTRWFNGLMDEVRISSVDRPEDWTESEYTNMDSPTTFYATSTPEVFTTPSFVELDYWVQHFDNATDEADIWVQIDILEATASSTIYLYYGNGGAVSESDEHAPFTYSTTTDIYYVVDDDSTGPIVVYSYIDDNLVAIDGGTPVALDAGETTSFSTYSGASVISSLGPIAATINSAGADSIAPIAFAATTQVSPTNRNANEYFVRSPLADSTVNTYIGGSGTLDQTSSVSSTTVATFTTDPGGTDGVVITSTNPVLVSHQAVSGQEDSYVLYPPTLRDIFGIRSNTTYISTVTDNPDPTVYCSSGSSASVTGVTRGEQQAEATCANGADGAGNAVRFTGQSNPIVAIQQADGDGGETTAFWPQHEFSTEYYLATDVAYVAVVCSPRFGAATLEVQTNDGMTTLDSATCSPTSATSPGKAYMNNGLDGDVLAFSAGAKVVSTNGIPFYAIYEDDVEDNDETNILAAPQGRKFGSDSFAYTFGAQEVSIDAQYTQNSFRWYENVNAQTPTTPWDLLEEGLADEGDNIIGAAAVDTGEVLRLRMNLAVGNATGTQGTTAMKLQYTEAETCNLAPNIWSDVGPVGSTTSAFSGYNNAAVVDGSAISTTTLASTSKSATYEEENPSEFLPNELIIGDYAEYDWALTSVNTTPNANYCFRMVRVAGSELAGYTSYPQLITSGPPEVPTLLVYFDNERTADTIPVLEFVSTDATTDDIGYQVQVDNDRSFSSTAIDKNSITNFLQFENLNSPSDKSPFNSGDRVRFTSQTSLSADTYYWRVRAIDPDGSNTYSEWSEPFSFTVSAGITVSEWHQTTGHQFGTDSLFSLSTSTGAVSVTGSFGELTTSAIDFNDATVGNAWGSVSWSHTETSGAITYQVEYNNNGSWELIPNSEIPGNSLGIGTSPINILGLDTAIYNEIRVVATFVGTTLSIQDLTVKWGEKIIAPVLGDPFDNEKIADTTPTFTFVTTDPQGDDLIYQVSYGTDASFSASTTVETATTTSGTLASYTVPGALTNGQTYWWRVRARDPLPSGDNTFSNWSDADSFTVDTGVTVSTWFQTTNEQFRANSNSGLEAAGGSITITDEVGEYGTVDLAPGTWVEVSTLREYTDMVVVASPEYAGGTDDHRSPRVRSKGTGTFEIKVDDDNGSYSGTTTVDYIVMEAGTWTLADGGSGIQVVAGTKESVSAVQVKAYSNGNSELVSFSPSFSGAPSALATVSSDNDTSWVSTHIDDGSNSGNEVTTTGMGLALGRQITTGIHSPEDIDYMVFGTANGTNNSVAYRAFKSPNTVSCCNTGIGVTYASAFGTAPAITVVHSNGTNGGDGTTIYKELDTASTNSTLYLQAGEIGTAAGTHATEVVSIVAFESASGILLRTAVGSLTGTMYGEEIPFSDGSGPKFENFSWNNSTPGASTLTYQVQYFNGTSWALIPDGSIPGNSTGISSSPVDLTGVAVATYNTIRLVANFTCSGANCPSVNDWQVTWAEGVDLSGTAFEYDRTTVVNSGDTVRVAVNGTLQANTGTITAGTWIINNVTAFPGDTVTVFVDGAAEADEAVNVFVYDGIGDMTGVALYEQHLTFNSNEKGTTTNAALAAYDFSVSGDEDIFFDVDGANDLNVCAQGTCSSANLYIGSGHIFIPDTTGSGNVRTHDFINDGTIELDANTLRVNGSWDNNATVVLDTSTVIFTATTSTETIDGPATTATFYRVTFGETSGSATWNIVDTTLDVNNHLSVAQGTLSRNARTITVAGNVTTGVGGFWSGAGNTTFDGTGLANWSDANPVKQSIGTTTLAGTGKTVTLTSPVRASAITINTGNTLNGGGAHTLFLSGNFTNNATFVPQTSTIVIDGAAVNATIKAGASSLYSLTASTTGGGMISFSDSTVGLLGNLTIATGTVNMPTTLITIAGSLANNGGFFTHNNAEVRFTGSGSKSVLANGTVFYNKFYNLTFAGPGTYSLLDANATTTNDLLITSGSVVLPSTDLTVGADFTVSGSGSVNANNGKVTLLIQGPDTLALNGSSLNNVDFILPGGVPQVWYNALWNKRKAVTLQSSQVDSTLTNFPVYIDLSTMGADFWSSVKSDGSDIRVTAGDALTEMPVEVTSFSTTTQTGQLYFRANSVSSTVDTTFYVYYHNPAASAYATTATYGRNNVWSNNYRAVYHFNVGGIAGRGNVGQYVDSTGNGFDATDETAATGITGLFGRGVEFRPANSTYGGTGIVDHIEIPYLVLDLVPEMTYTVWYTTTNSSVLHTFLSGARAAQSNALINWSNTNTGLQQFEEGASTGVTISAIANAGWRQYGFTRSVAAGNLGFFLNGTQTAGSPTTATAPISAIDVDVNGLNIGLEQDNVGSGTQVNQELDGFIDEARFSSVIRAAGWMSAEYRNQNTPATFYSLAAQEVSVVQTRTFTETTASIVGNIFINAGQVTLPSGTLNAGGSFDNNGVMAANSGTVNFNSATGTETISFGTSNPHNLVFNSAGGDWTVIDSATTTGNVTLTSANNFTLQSGRTLAVGGQFTNNANGANTTWAGTVLTLLSGSDYSINTKGSSGDVYGTVRVTGDGDIAMWNSSAGTYDMQNTASLYSQDHANVDGDLFIFGDYIRSTGTEFWSYGTDFDGTSLSGSERQVFVFIAPSGIVSINGASLSMLGVSGATTTVQSQSGTYALSLNTSTLNADYFSMTGTNAAGLSLLSSTTVSTFTNGQFTIAAASSAITVDATTVDTGPAKEIFDLGFSAASGGTNVTLSGSPTSYWWFRNGSGNRYGEAFDAGDGNPGSIRWDDSTYGITVAGTVFSDDGVTPIGFPVCDDVSPVVRIVVNGTDVAGGPCSSIDSTYSITGVTFVGDPSMTVYLDNNRQPAQPAAITLRSETTGNGSTNGTTGAFTVNKPASVQNGDTLVVIIGKDDSPAVTPPAGWITGDSLGSGAGNLIRTGIFYKRVTNATTEPASYTFTGDISEAFSYWAGSLVAVNPSAPQEVAFTSRWLNSQNDTTPNALTLTTAATGAYVLAASYIDNDNAVTAPGAPWATRAVNIFFAGDNNNLVVSSRSMVPAGATGGTTVTGVAGGMESNNGQFAFRRMTYSPTSVRGAVVTRTPNANITNMDIYQNRVITRHEGGAVLGITNMVAFDSDNDSDIPFTAVSGGPNTLSIAGGSGLYVWNNKTFTPNGNVTINSNGAATVQNGTLTVANGGTFTAQGTETHTVGGSFTLGTGSTFTPASSLVVMTATTTGKTISAVSGTNNFNNLSFTGTGGAWTLNNNVTALNNVTITAGSVSGTSNLTLENGSLTGNGALSLTGGTTLIKKTNTLGGTTPWTFQNLTLGDGTVGVTTRGAVATANIRGVLTVATAHTFNAGASTYNLSGTGNVFVENGTFNEDTSTVVYSGTGSNVRATPYYNLSLNSAAGPATYVAPTVGLLVANDLLVGQSAGVSTFNLNTNDPLTSVGGNVLIGANGVVLGSNIRTLTVAGNWTNTGTFTHNSGTVTFSVPVSSTVSPGSSSFASLNIAGVGSVVIANNATATANMNIASTTTFTQTSGTTLAVGGQFTNNTNGTNTTWTGSTLALYSGTQYVVNSKTSQDTYATVTTALNTHPRIWNSSFGSVVTAPASSVYSMDHAGTVGNLYIYGDYVNTAYSDNWSYATDFDGTVLGAPRQAAVYIEGGGSATYTGGGLSVQGSTTASTTIQNQGSGTYALAIGGTSNFLLRYSVPRNLGTAGISFSGTPVITDIADNNFLIQTNSASAMTTTGGAINANPALNFNRNGFSDDVGVTGAINVTVSGAAVSSWRFTNEYGDRAGESYDADSGNPGEIVWSDSAALITVSGRVYQNEGSVASPACDGVTPNVRLVVAGLTSASTTCDGTGLYTFTNVGFGPADSIIVYIDGEPEKGSTITTDPISNILNMDIYENRVIVRHENTDPVRIADLEVWDSDDDADVQFDAELGPNTVVFNANTKLIIWTGKTFTPAGDVTVSGGGAGAAHDGTFQAFANSKFIAAGTQTHTIGGSFILDAGATFTAATSNIVLTTSGAARTVDINNGTFNDLTFNGTGSWTMSDTSVSIFDDLTITSGAVTLPTATTTIFGSFDNTGGSFVNSSGTLRFASTGAGNVVRLGGSNVHNLLFNGTGSWTMPTVNATSTGNVTVSTGTLTLPSGTFAVSGDFINQANITHNSGTLLLNAAAGSKTITLNGSDLYTLRVTGATNFAMTDASAALLGNLEISNGTLALSANTLSIGGSLDATAGTMTVATGTVLFNSADAGETINPGSNNFYNLVIGNATGGWTLNNATTTNNFTLSAAANFVLGNGNTLSVGNVFTNNVLDVNTTWTNTTLTLLSSADYTVNPKTVGDSYENITVAAGSDIRFWNSSFVSTTLGAGASIYSQDNGNVPGALGIYGALDLATTTENWSYATDFDGTTLVGAARRAVDVTFYGAVTSSLAMTSGTLNIVGVSGATTTVQSDGVYRYPFAVSGGTLNATYYSFNDMNVDGLNLSALTTVTTLSYGEFLLAGNTSKAISLPVATLNYNPSKTFTGVRFNANGFTGGVNVNLTGATSNSWKFTSGFGDLDGEAFDVDGIDDCGSIRFDDSDCLLVEQTHFRWRHDGGGLGVPDSEWFDLSWTKRQRVRVVNNDNTTYGTTSAKVIVPYDADMQTDFDDLRFMATDGVTPVPYWIENADVATEAIVWVALSSLPASGSTDLYMYYGSTTVASISNGAAVFNVFDDFEDGNISEYSGNTSLFTVGGTFAFGGSNGLDTTGFESSRATDGIYRTDVSTAQGQTIHYRQYIDTTAGVGDEVCTLFGVQSPGSSNLNYAVCLEQFGTDRMSLVKNAESTDSYGSVSIPALASSTVTFATGWYEVFIDWNTDNSIAVSLYDSTNTLAASISATDSTYTSGGIGFTYWGQNGGWDSYFSYPRTTSVPSVVLGFEQTPGGADWAAVQDAVGYGFDVGDVARLRFSIDNSGLDITDQEFQIEFAPKGVAPSCGAVSGASYTPVPSIASCGSSAICLATTTHYTSGDATFDLLTDTTGLFVAGQAMQNPDNKTTVFDVDEGYYTEVEYAIQTTVNISDDSYCFRVTDDGTDLDSYNTVAELSLQYAPVVAGLTLNDGLSISLIPGTTTTVYATGTVSDLNGYADLAYATTTFYRSGVAGGAACTADNNDCYIASGPQCSFLDCAGTSCTVSCYVDVYFHADATDSGVYSGEEWFAFVEVEDFAAGYDADTAIGQELSTLRAIDVAGAINYGTLTVNTDTGAYNASTTVLNEGNVEINIEVQGTDLTDGLASSIPASEQKFATSTFTYSACATCSSLSSSSPVALDVDLSKPTTSFPPVEDEVFWGIAIPFGTNSVAHQGINVFTPISP